MVDSLIKLTETARDGDIVILTVDTKNNPDIIKHLSEELSSTDLGANIGFVILPSDVTAIDINDVSILNSAITVYEEAIVTMKNFIELIKDGKDGD